MIRLIVCKLARSSSNQAEPANGGIGTTASALIRRIDISGEKEVGVEGIFALYTYSCA